LGKKFIGGDTLHVRFLVSFHVKSSSSFFSNTIEKQVL